MLPREKRLLNTRDFKRVYQKGSFLGSGLFTLNYLPNRTTQSRLGVVIAKKIEKSAVKRNAVKRKFRAVAQKLYPDIPAGYDIVLNIKAAAKEAEFAAIEAEFKKALERMGK